MFEYNEETLTLDELKDVAKISGVEFDSFYNEGLNDGSIVEKTNDVAETGAPVASELQAPGSGDSPLESTSSVVPYDDTGDKHDWLNYQTQEGTSTKPFFNLAEEEAVLQLKEKYPGFKFEETNIYEGLGSLNAIKITSPDGKDSKKIEFRIDLFAGKEDQQKTAYEKAYSDLTSFVNKYSTEQTDKDYAVARAERSQSYRTYTDNVKYTEQEEVDINEKYSAENLFEPVSKEKKVFRGGGMDIKFGGGIPQTVTTTSQPYKEELELAFKRLRALGVENPNKEQVQEKAREILINNDLNKIIDKNSTNLLDQGEDLGLEGQQQRLALATKEFENEYNSKLAHAEGLRYELEEGGTASKLSTTVGRFEDEDYEFEIIEGEEVVTLESGKLVPLRVFDEYLDNTKKFNTDLENFKLLQNDIISNSHYIERTTDQLDLLKRNYNGWEEFVVETGLGFAEMGIGSAYGGSRFFGQQDDFTNEAYIDFKNKVNNIRDSYKKDVEFDDAFSSIAAFGEFAAQELSNQIPIFASLATPTGMAYIGAQSFGDQYSDMVRSDKSLLGEKTSQAEKWFSSLGYATSEVVFESLTTLPLIRNAKSAFLNNPVKNQMFSDGVKSYFKNNASRALVYSPLLESTSEGLTTISQNLISGNPITEGLDHAMFSGLMFGTTLSVTPFVKGVYVSKFSDYDTRQQARQNIAEAGDLFRLNQRINKQIKKTGFSKLGTKEDVEANNRRIEELQALNEIEYAATEEKVKTLTPKAAEQFFDLSNRQEAIRLEAERIRGIEAMPQNVKESKLADLKAEFDGVQGSLDQFRASNTFNNNWTLFSGDKNNKSEIDRINEQAELAILEQDGISDPNAEQISEKARIIYNTEIINKDIAKKTKKKTTALRNTLAAHQTIEETISFLEKDAIAKINNLDPSLSENEKSRIEDSINKELAENIIEVNKGAHGFMVVNANNEFVSVVNVENMAKADRLETKTHELQHVVFMDAIGFDPASYKGLSDQILSWTKENNSEVYERINAYAERRKTDDSMLEQEVVAVFFEEIAAGNINLNKKKNSTFAGLLGYLIGQGTKESTDIDIDLAGETDAIKFLVGLANKIKNDQLTLADLSDVKKNEIIKSIVKGDKPKTTQFSKEFYKELSAEDLATIIKSRSSTERQVNDATSVLVDQFDLLALKALNYDTRKGEIARGNVISEARKYFTGILERFNPATAKFSTFVYSNMSPKKEVVYEAAKDLGYGQESLDSEQAKEVADTPVEAVEDTKSVQARAKIDILKFNTVGRVADKIKSLVKVVKGDTFKEIISKYAGKAGELVFNIPAKKIMEGGANLIPTTKIKEGMAMPSEALNIQRFFGASQNMEKFIKTLPLYNVTEMTADINKVGENIDVSRDTYGIAVGLKGLPLDYFYQAFVDPTGVMTSPKGRSKGLSSQTPVKKLKPEFVNPTSETIEKVKRDIGITPRGEKSTYNRDIGQLLKGFAKVYSINASLSAAQRFQEAKLKKAPAEQKKAIKQQTADITAAQSKIAFSKAFNVRPEFRIDLSAIKNERRAVNKLLKLHDLGRTFEVKSINDIKPFIDNVVLPLFKLGPKEMFVGPRGGTVFTSSNKNLGIKSSKDPVWIKFVEQVQEAVETAEFGENIPGVKNSEIWELRNKYETLFGNPAKAKKAIKDGRVKDFNNKVSKIHRELWNRISESIKNDRNNAVSLATYLTFVANDTGHWHKLGAQFAGYSKKILGKRYEFEHAMPATAAYNYLLDAAITDADNKTNDFNASYNLIIDNYKLIALDKAMDDKLRNARTASGFSLQKVMPDDWSPILNNWYERYFNNIVAAQDGGIDPASIEGLDGRTFDKIYNVNVEGNTMFSKPVGNKPIMSETISNARPVMQYSKESRGMSTFDFDETLIIDGKNFVTATKGGETVKIPSDKWPIDGPKYAEEGYSFDFSDFANVRGGKQGPLLQKMKNQINKYGNKNVFVLTARMQEAAEPIHKWLKSNGITIPIENITGLGRSEGDAKAQWFIDKYAEGYNDMYFVDDALPNVKAVKHVFDQLDVKGKSVQAKIQFSKDLSPKFNQMLERTKGIGAEKTFSRIGAQKRGKNVGRFTFFVPPSADDFVGLLRYFVGKGEQGNKDIAFFNKALIKPFARADEEMKRRRQTITDDYKALRKEFPQVKKKLGKMIGESGFTYDNAIRVYLWTKAGFEVPGLSKRDIKLLTETVAKDADLQAFANTLGLISKMEDGYVKPGEYWNVESIAADLENIVNKVNRKKYLAEWIENKDIIFSEDNLNKIEATYGSNFREALENILWRMENGTNRAKGMGRLESSWNNWVNNSVGAIMFFNARSAVLQTLSTVNFINYEDNNVFAAAKAFANQKQYWSDFAFLFNSDFLKQRRAGLSINVNEAELASAVAGATNKAKAALQYLLKIGFLPTQIADSFAIASGGSTYYRNRVKKYVKEGLDQKAAEEQAMVDFMEIAEETQQSSRPDRISQQQASSLGRIILAFANTPMQYNRLIKKAAGDLINKRGDWRSNISRIVYYGAIQNIIFSGLQSAIFALAFDDEDDDEQLNKKSDRMLHGMIDSLLRGSGLAGAVVATVKNTIRKFLEESDKGWKADYGNVIVEALNVSPPLGSKVRKLYNSTKTYKFNREVMGEMSTFDLENPIWDVVGNVVEATTNLPLNRGFRKIDNVKEMLNQDNETWQRIFVGLGWDQWGLGIDSRKEVDAAKEIVKEKKKEQKKKDKAEKKKNQNRCTKIKSDGTRCKMMVDKPKKRCHYHD